jgi:hypothetical protein
VALCKLGSGALRRRRRTTSRRRRLSLSSFAVEVLVRCVGVHFGLVHRPVNMLGRTVDCVQLEGFVTHASDVMAGSLRHHDAIVRRDGIARAVDPSQHSLPS